jgi:hypothetical protein
MKDQHTVTVDENAWVIEHILEPLMLSDEFV